MLNSAPQRFGQSKNLASITSINVYSQGARLQRLARPGHTTQALNRNPTPTGTIAWPRAVLLNSHSAAGEH
jgi:hypothetical protein